MAMVMVMEMIAIVLTGDCDWNEGNVDGMVEEVMWPLIEHLGF